MWRVAVADMSFRRRRFIITVLAAALVFAMTLLTSGANAALQHQDRSIVESFQADRWFVAAGSSGPFTTTTPVPASTAEEVTALPGITRANPVVLFRATVDDDGPRDVNVVATPPNGLGAPTLASGRQPNETGEIVVDTALDSEAGSTLNVGGHSMLVVGTAKNASYYFGTPTVFMTLADAQANFFGFLPLASAIVAQGEPSGAVAGLRELTIEQVRDDLKRPTKRSEETIQFINLLLWIAAIGIVGSIVYLSAIERVREFAVMKATGASNASLLVGLAIQAILLSLASAIVAAVMARLMSPGFPFEVRVTASTYVALLIVAVIVGLVASGAGLRRAVKVDPALAFGGS